MIAWKINDREVTKEEWDAHFAEKEKVVGKDFFDFSKWGGRAPEVRTNDTFMRGKKHGGDLAMTPDTFAEYQRMAAAQGVSTSGKHYFGQLADGAGDAEAWCGSVDDAIAVAKRKKMKVELNGRTYDFRDKYADPCTSDTYQVAEDMVAEDVERRIEREYGTDGGKKLTKKQKAELREQVREAIKPEGW